MNKLEGPREVTRTVRVLERISIQKRFKVLMHTVWKENTGAWATLEQFVKVLYKENILGVAGIETGLTFNRMCCNFSARSHSSK